MQALVLERKGELTIRDIDLPMHVGPHDVKVAMHTVGICGSDIHYYTHGGIGDYIVKKPMVLGHEASGTVVEVGESVTGFNVGDRVCMEPGIPNLASRSSKLGIYNVDPDVRFWATPPDHGVLTPFVVHPAAFTYVLPENVSFAMGAMIEPFAIGMQAAARARIVPGDVAVVTGCGTIGFMVALAALAGGCSKVIISDISAPKLEIASGFSGIVPVNVENEALRDAVSAHTKGWGADIVFEASGSPRAFKDLISVTRPGGAIVLIGLPPDEVPFNVNNAIAKELRIETVFRYANVFDRALDLIASGQVDLNPLISKTFTFDESIAAFERAAQGRPADIKLQIQMPAEGLGVMAEIRCHHLNKKYGDIEVVEDFSLKVNDEEFVVFLGPSGCGKSTILRMIAGLEDITGGDLFIDEKLMNLAEPMDRGIAMVFQNYALYPHMNIEDNIVFGLRRMKTPAADIATKLTTVTQMLGIKPVLKRKPTELSGGQQQRVAIARAIIKTPDVFLFDEPLSNLDAQLRAQMRAEIARLHKELKTTTVYVTHDQMEAMTLADRIVLLNAGSIEQIGTPEDIYKRPQTRFVAGFIGTPAMSFLSAIVQSDTNSWRLEGSGFSFPLSRDRFNVQEGQAVTIGIRPAEVKFDFTSTQPITIQGKAELSEFHGDNYLVNMPIGDSSISVFLPADRRPVEGDDLKLGFHETSLHLFDDKTGASLLQEPTGC